MAKWPRNGGSFLVKYYIEKGPIWCAEELGFHPGTISRKAGELGLYRRNVRWTSEEEAILLLRYSAEGPARVAKIIPRHTKRAIGLRAMNLGIKYIPTCIVCREQELAHGNAKYCTKKICQHIAKYQYISTISAPELHSVWMVQKGLCAICGETIDLDVSYPLWWSSSLDKINPSGKYINKNVQWVHTRCNQVKGDMLLEEMYILVTKIQANREE